MPLPREAKCGGCGPESSDLCRATRLAQPHTLTQVSELCFSASALSTAPTHPCRPSPTQLMLDGCVGGVYLSTVLSDSIFLCGPEVSQVGGAEAGRWYHLCGNQPKEMRLSENDGESSNPLPAFSLQLVSSSYPDLLCARLRALHQGHNNQEPRVWGGVGEERQ